MTSQSVKISNFLKAHRMHWTDIVWDEAIKTFRIEMKNGLEGKPSSLAMIPTYIDPTLDFHKNEKVIVMDAGGTNFRIATVEIKESGDIKIQDFKKRTMPGVKRQVSKEEFFQSIVDWLKPVINKSDRIGFCFSYPMEMHSNLDGKLLYFTKEIKAPEVEGRMIGEELKAALTKNKLDSNKKITIINDTVATLLAGKAQGMYSDYGDYLGFILGTGCNLAYTESNSNIKKLNYQKAGFQVINLESGNYSGLIQGQADLNLNKTTNNPGAYQFEKKVGGAYFGKLCHQIIELGIEELFSLEFKSLYNKWDEITTKEVGDFLQTPNKDNKFIALNQKDKETLYYLFDEMVTRAARCVAAKLAAVMIQSGKNHNPLNPICINIDGSTIHKTHSYKSKLKFFLRQECLFNKKIYYDFTTVDEAPIVGAAIAGLM